MQYLFKKYKRLAKIISLIGPITYERHHENLFQFFIHEIIEQMLSFKVDNKIFSRLIELCNDKVTPERIRNLTIEQIKSIGTLKANFIIGITNSVISGELKFNKLPNLSDEEVIKQITALHDVGGH